MEEKEDTWNIAKNPVVILLINKGGVFILIALAPIYMLITSGENSNLWSILGNSLVLVILILALLFFNRDGLKGTFTRGKDGAISGELSTEAIDSKRMDELEKQLKEISARIEEKKEAGQVKQVDGKEAVDLSPEDMEKLIRVEKGIDTAYEDWQKVRDSLNAPRLMTLLVDDSKALREAGKYYEAQKRAEQAYQMDPTNFDTLNQLGRCLKEIGEYEKAERKLRDAIDAANTDPDKSAALGNLAGVLRDKGKYDEAETLLREALAIRRKAYAEGHPSIATTLGNLAGVLKDQGKYDEAEELYQEALAICRKAYAEEHPYIATTLGNLAGVLRDQGKYDEAEKLYREALAIDRKAYAEGHPHIAIGLNNLALVLKDQRKFDEAEKLGEKALEMMTKAVGPDHPNTKQLKSNLDDIKKDKAK